MAAAGGAADRGGSGEENERSRLGAGRVVTLEILVAAPKWVIVLGFGPAGSLTKLAEAGGVRWVDAGR